MTDRIPARLRLAGISKNYGAFAALKDVNFEIQPGEVMALLGENGAGKSSIVKVLAGLIEPDAGTIELDGEMVRLHSVSASRDVGVAVVHQEFSAVPVLTVAENLALGRPGSPWLWWPPTLSADAKAMLRRVGLEHISPQAQVKDLTVAEQQLLEIAKVLAVDARVVIFDEPTAALADEDIDRILGAVKTLAEEGRSVIYVTHRLGEVFRIADTILVMRNGASLPARGVAESSPDSVVAAMLGRDLGSMYPPDRDQQSEGETVLELDQVGSPYLEGLLSVRVRAGEILGLAGQMGSGASQVLEIIAGTLPRSGGQIRVGGHQLKRTGRADGIRNGVAYCSPSRKRDGVFAEKSALQNLTSPWLDSVSTATWIKRSKEARAAQAVGAEFAFDPKRMSTKVGDLSGGNQQKIALGKWVGIAPKVLLVDEPTRGVDVGARAEIYTRIRALADAGAAVVVASSDTGELLGLCDTVASFSRGQMTAIRPHHEWSEDQLLLDVMHAGPRKEPA